jgi:hypothetical protein
MVFSPKFQSCLSPRLQPPINNPPRLKLPSSCWTTLSAQCCLPGGTISLFEPSLLHAFYLLLRGLVLFVPNSLPQILLSEHASSYGQCGWVVRWTFGIPKVVGSNPARVGASHQSSSLLVPWEPFHHLISFQYYVVPSNTRIDACLDIYQILFTGL